MEYSVQELTQKVEQEKHLIVELMQEVNKVIVGQQYLIERLLIGLLSEGHVLVEGVPGLAKTTTIKTLADCLSIKFGRIQFTPDLLPADLIGTQIYSPKDGSFNVKKGPIFANIILADEINRSPAKVQSALLEGMQEGQVTIGEDTFDLPSPFLVMATQNPVEQEGTYPLPEAQVDRFMLKVKISYPSKKEEVEIMKRMTKGGVHHEVKPVLSAEKILSLKKLIGDIFVDEKIYQYCADLIFASRTPEAYGMKDLKNYIEYGCSPRASIFLIKAAKAWAFLQGRGYVTPQDVKTTAHDVMRHRLLVSYEAEAQEMTSDDILQKILERVDVP